MDEVPPAALYVFVAWLVFVAVTGVARVTVFTVLAVSTLVAVFAYYHFLPAIGL